MVQRGPRVAIGRIVVAVALVLAAAGCGIDAGRAAALDRDAIERQVHAALALVETPLSTGSAVLVADGYLITNAHVVDPFSVADVAFPGRPVAADVPVVGVDLVADLALLGPVEVDAEPLALADAAEVAPGTEAHLAGFPGDQTERHPKLRITDGRIVGPRRADGWDLDYVAADAPIAGGQSGGALVDQWGRVIGISGLEDADGLALALSGAEVAERLGDLRAGGDPAYRPVPTVVDHRSWSFDAPAPWDPRAWYLPAAEADRTLVLQVTGGHPLVAIGDPGEASQPWAVSPGAREIGDGGWWWAGDAQVIPLDGAGRWRVDIPAWTDAVITVAGDGTGDPMAVRSSIPLAASPGVPDVEPLAVGDRDRDDLGYLDDYLVYDLDLEAGTPLEVSARSASGDLAWTLVATDPDVAADNDGEVAFADDGGGGLLDLDAVAVVRPPADGEYQLYVFSVDHTATEVLVSVQPA